MLIKKQVYPNIYAMTKKDINPEMPAASAYALPKVSKEITQSLLADALEQGAKNIVEQAEERLQANNPELYLAVGQFTAGMNLQSPQELRVAHQVMIMTHELLRRQAETDALNRMLATPEAGNQS